jgi:hypothetical protein
MGTRTLGLATTVAGVVDGAAAADGVAVDSMVAVDSVAAVDAANCHRFKSLLQYQGRPISLGRPLSFLLIHRGATFWPDRYL